KVCEQRQAGVTQMAKTASTKSRAARSREGIPANQVRERVHAPAGDSKIGATIRFSALLHRPAGSGKPASWTFLNLPKEARARLPWGGQATVEGTLNGRPFQATLEPDGQGGHWLKVDRKLREAAGAEVGDVVTLEVTPVAEEPEPKVPADLRKALAGA